LQLGDFERACNLFQDSVQYTQKAGLMIALVFAVEGLASLYVHQDQPKRAARLFAWADAMREKIGDRRPPLEQAFVDHYLEIIHSKLSDSDFARLSTAGQAMTVEEAIKLVFEE
jgi:hypothetical protein